MKVKPTMAETLPKSRWSTDTAWKWHEKLPYLVGANFLPSTAINQLEMWQAESFDPTTIDRELGWAAALGMNVMRVYLHDLLWQQDAKGFCQRMDQYLTIAHKHGIRTLFTVFDDCWNQQFALGTQPKPKPATHNSGWVQSPGNHRVNDPATWGNLKQYVTELLTRFGQDSRIVAWDLYNEPGNGASGDAEGGAEKQGKRSLAFLTAVFGWARGVGGVTQPLTVGVWNTGKEFAELNAFSLENSDIISFHNYEPPQKLVDFIQKMAKLDRPMICTEYMCRGNGSTFEFCLPILAKYQVGAINWGLVSGKSQTIYPWGWNPEKGVPDVWFHDIFEADGRMLYPHEEGVFKRIRRG